MGERYDCRGVVEHDYDYDDDDDYDYDDEHEEEEDGGMVLGEAVGLLVGIRGA